MEEALYEDEVALLRRVMSSFGRHLDAVGDAYDGGEPPPHLDGLEELAEELERRYPPPATLTVIRGGVA